MYSVHAFTKLSLRYSKPIMELKFNVNSNVSQVTEAIMNNEDMSSFGVFSVLDRTRVVQLPC